MIAIGTVLDGRYKVLEKVGQGGMSVVYLAMDNRLNKPVAVKEIRKRDSHNTELLLKSLTAEANMLKKFDHFSLPKIYDIIESKGNIYVVMDYIEGGTLKEKLDLEGVQPPERVIDWALKIADVLEYLHTRKPHPIIYRDMKPHNLMVTSEGKIKLIDFGISREYQEGADEITANLGTREYAAPEQLAGKPVDVRSDIYSLGVTLYQLVTGKTINDYPHKLLPIREWNSSLPEGLEHIISKCTKPEPENRYQSCAELIFDLENIEKLSRGYKLGLIKQARKFLISAAGVLLCLSLTLVGFSGMKEEAVEDYMLMLSQSNRLLLDGNDSQAIEILEKAITEVDNSKPEAYIYLLDIYINRDEVDMGLAKIESYINERYGNLHRNDDVLFKVAMTYFDVKRDYLSALRYFHKINERRVPSAGHYKVIAEHLSVFTTDYEELADQLHQFELFNDELPNNERKIENYNTIAGIYLSYKGAIEGANDKTIGIVEKALSVMESIDSKELNFKFKASLIKKIAQAYYSRAIGEGNTYEAQHDYNRAINYYEKLLDLMDGEDEDTLVTIGMIYQDMQEYRKAVSYYTRAVHFNPQSIDSRIRLINAMLDVRQYNPETERNDVQILDLYHILKEMPGARESAGFERLTRRMQSMELI